MRKIKFSAVLLVIVWGCLTLMVWFHEDVAISEQERRPLKQKTPITVEKLADGSYMKNFEGYALDQFPFRNEFRKIKSLVHYYSLGQKDNNGIYIYNQQAGKIDYPLNPASVDFASRKFEEIYEMYLKGKSEKILMAIVPDKGYYMAKNSGHLAYDYDQLMEDVEKKTPWADHVNLVDLLSLDDYYKTDTHWRQEKILPVAKRISEKLQVNISKEYTYDELKRPFYGVFYGQAALPMKPDQMTIMRNHILDKCQVLDYETGKKLKVYDMEKAQGKDMYETYLSGAKALLEIENPKGKPGKKLVVFRDSFASSLVPLLVKDYAKITLIDTRYIAQNQLGPLVDFEGADVLFLYNTLLINNSIVLK